jgi:hypothetical protein
MRGRSRRMRRGMRRGMSRRGRLSLRSRRR